MQTGNSVKLCVAIVLSVIIYVRFCVQANSEKTPSSLFILQYPLAFIHCLQEHPNGLLYIIPAADGLCAINTASALNRRGPRSFSSTHCIRLIAYAYDRIAPS
eukprot:scaffold7676_cov100-Skeletonema_dohrnii-CCMP3373.AAC.3